MELRAGTRWRRSAASSEALFGSTRDDAIGFCHPRAHHASRNQWALAATGALARIVA
jgi:hypothetical protein